MDKNTFLRMRALLMEDAALGRGADSYDEDLESVIGEIERVRVRNDHWLALIEGMSGPQSAR